MGRDIVDIIMEKSFAELSDEERAELTEFCATEEEFMQMKHVFASVESMDYRQEAPRAEIKEKLDHLFEKTYPAAMPLWYNSFFAVFIPRDKPLYRQPMLHIAAILVLIFLAVPLMQQESLSSDKLIAEVSSEDVISEDNAVNGTGVAEPANDSDVNLAAEEEPSPAILSGSSAVGGNQANFQDAEARTRSISSASGAMMAPGSNHPDGIFGGSDEGFVSMSVSAQE